MELTSLGPPVRITHTSHINVCEHTDVIHHIEYDFYSRRLALVSSDKSVSVYDKMPHNRGWTKTGCFRVHGGATWKVRWAHAMFGQILATASFNGSVYIFQESTSMNDDIEERSLALKNKAQLIECNWTERAHITSPKPTSITDIRFAPHFTGLILGVCNGLGQVHIYECPGPDNLDNWSLVQKMSIFKPRRCKSIAFSTDRFSTLLIAVCSDDDRVRDNKNVAVFAFARTEQRIPYPEVIFFVPSADLSVHFPPVDLEFSPTGAFEFQRLAIAVGPCIIIYHISVIEHERTRPESPLSTISENSVNTVINVASSKTDDELNFDEDEESLSDVIAMDSLYGMTSDSSKDSKHMKKAVHFNFEPPSPGKRSPSPKTDVSQVSSKPEGSVSTTSTTEKRQLIPTNNSLTPRPRSKTEPSPSSPLLSDQKSLKSELATEEEAEDADSETSEYTTADSADTKSQPSPSRARMDRRPLWTSATPAQKTHSAIFSDDESSAPPPLIRRDLSSFARKKPEPPKQPEQVKVEIRKKGKVKSKRKRMPISDNKSTDDESQKPTTTTFDAFSTSSNESAAPVDAVLSAVRKLTKDRRVPTSPNQPIALPPPSLAVEARATPEFNVVDGRKESATIHIEAPPISAEDAAIVSDMIMEEDDSDTVRIIMERKAVLRSNRSQVKRITFNQTGSLLTAVYVDGRVRVWRRVNPMLWQCLTVVDPPMIKGKEGLEVTHEQAYY